MTSPEVQILNDRLGSSLGWRGRNPRFAWRWSADEDWLVYDADDRTLLKKKWADMPAANGGTVGRAWVLAEWRRSQVFDHMGFGTGIRVPFTKEWGYFPYLETTVPAGKVPDAELTQNYIWALASMIDQSAAEKEGSFENYVAEEAWTSQQNAERDKIANRERAAAEYDKYTGAFGNLDVGARDGYFSFQNAESGPSAESGTGFFAPEQAA
jgi:hypothetical protein